MALGISDAFPCAKFLHAFRPDDIKPHHLLNRRIVLVDAVINSGKTIVNFVQHLRPKRADGVPRRDIPIIIVAGVVQFGALSQSKYADILADCNELSIVALRISSNMYAATGKTDTGNRLLNTIDYFDQGP
ncbi:hypothetical protein GGR52DRAFT_589883 [Hypoxylon sp. FL1284]|nr:hypothetical protein GGR52DRAFT_589883 [Hypoxylon sp. FL1284]